MPGSSKYLLIEHLLGRPLDNQLREWRRARVSGPAMARLLTLETQISISPQAVRMWLHALDDGHANGGTEAA